MRFRVLSIVAVTAVGVSLLGADATVVEADIEAKTGIIHVLDIVLSS